MNDRDRERVKSLIKDLVATLNDFGNHIRFHSELESQENQI